MTGTRNRTLTGLAAAGLALLGSMATPADAVASSQHWVRCVGRLDGLRVPVGAATASVVTVHQTSRTWARVTLWRRRSSAACGFSRVFVDSQGRLGYGGTVAGARRVQDTGTTPRGVYTMTQAFGVAPAPRTAMPYRHVGPRDYWVEDNASRWYNTYRSSSQGGFRTGAAWSERLADYPVQYRYAVAVNFNTPPHAVRGRGAGIFLHVRGSGATAGCVAISRGNMVQVLHTIRPHDLIAIG